jgi:hypothetical protein
MILAYYLKKKNCRVLIFNILIYFLAFLIFLLVSLVRTNCAIFPNIIDIDSTTLELSVSSTPFSRLQEVFYGIWVYKRVVINCIIITSH